MGTSRVSIYSVGVGTRAPVCHSNASVYGNLNIRQCYVKRSQSVVENIHFISHSCCIGTYKACPSLVILTCT